MLEALRGIGREQASLPCGHVVIGTAASVAAMVAVPLVKLARERFPGITLELLESPGAYLGEMLLRGRVDIALLVGDYSGAGMHVEQVAEEDLFVIGMPQTEAEAETEAEVNLQRLDGVRLVMPARPNSLRTLFDRACSERGVTPQVVTEASSPHTMVQLVRAGLGATVLPLSMLGARGPRSCPRGAW